MYNIHGKSSVSTGNLNRNNILYNEKFNNGPKIQTNKENKSYLITYDDLGWNKTIILDLDPAHT